MDFVLSARGDSGRRRSGGRANHAYVGHLDPPHGTSILDISDPSIRVLSTLMLPTTRTPTGAGSWRHRWLINH